MGWTRETYIGAFLELRNVWEENPLIFRQCPDPTHGAAAARGSDAAFCKWCGKPIESIKKSMRVHKQVVDDKFKWEDWMFRVETEEKESIILIPNKNNSGQLVGESNQQVFFIKDGVKNACVERLNTFYADYITWLKEEKKFDVFVGFGVVKYNS